MGMGQYLLLSILMGWTSIYQLFWCELQGYQGFDPSPDVFLAKITSLHEILRWEHGWRGSTWDMISWLISWLYSQISSMGDLQDPTDGGTLVPYVWPYFVGIFTYIGLIYIGLIYGSYLHFRILFYSHLFHADTAIILCWLIAFLIFPHRCMPNHAHELLDLDIPRLLTNLDIYPLVI